MYEAYYDKNGPDVFYKGIMQLKNDYFNYTVGNDTMRKAFVTEIFTEMLQMMQTTIDACEQGYLDQIK